MTKKNLLVNLPVNVQICPEIFLLIFYKLANNFMTVPCWPYGLCSWTFLKLDTKMWATIFLVKHFFLLPVWHVSAGVGFLVQLCFHGCVARKLSAFAANDPGCVFCKGIVSAWNIPVLAAFVPVWHCSFSSSQFLSIHAVLTCSFCGCLQLWGFWLQLCFVQMLRFDIYETLYNLKQYVCLPYCLL